MCACPPCSRVGSGPYVDLELDAYKSSDGIAGVFDKDDFEAAIAGGHITREEEERAVAVGAELAARVRGHDVLFDDVGWARLREAVELQLPPITEV